jgi:hypothetical protein
MATTKAEITRVCHVFTTLDMFENADQIDIFLRSSDCQDPHMITHLELKERLMQLSPTQYARFDRFLVALRVKDEANKAKATEREIELEKQEKKKKQKLKILFSSNIRAQLTKPARFLPTLAPRLDSDLGSISTTQQNVYVLPTSSKNRRRRNQQKSLIRKLINFVRNRLGLSRTTGVKIGVISAEASEDLRMDDLFQDAVLFESDNDDPSEAGVRMRSRSEGSEADGLTSFRLTRNNMSIFCEETCSNDRMASYKVAGRQASAIEESLMSFDSFSERDISSRRRTSFN